MKDFLNYIFENNYHVYAVFAFAINFVIYPIFLTMRFFYSVPFVFQLAFMICLWWVFSFSREMIGVIKKSKKYDPLDIFSILLGVFMSCMFISVIY